MRIKKIRLIRFKSTSVFLFSFDNKNSGIVSLKKLLSKLLKISPVIAVCLLTLFQHSTVGSPLISTTPVLEVMSDTDSVRSDSVTNKKQSDSIVDEETLKSK